MAEIYDGGTLTFDALAYGKPHPSTLQFLANQYDSASTTLLNAGQAFFDQARDLYERVSGSHAMQVFRAAGRAIRSAWELDEIRSMQTIGQFQHAGPVMQRWLMAEPTVRKLYQQQRIDGYSESYFDHDPGVIGHEHYDYRRVMQGLVVMDKEPDADGEYGWRATTYFDELLPDDEELSLPEQLDIRDAWTHLRSWAAAGDEDPTSRYNAKMS